MKNKNVIMVIRTNLTEVADVYNHQLDAFMKAAELGSFGKAADAMFISTPALIQQINLLEAKCGVKVLVRSKHGVALTPAGKALYEDAATIVKLSGDALEKVRRIAATSSSTVRIGTSLLFKCRLFPDLWSKISARHPEMKIEILPLPEQEKHAQIFGGLGVQYDLVEGIYGSIAYAGRCRFLELMRTPFCCAVSKNHRLSCRTELALEDLGGECLVLPIEGVSEELDAFRREIITRYPSVRIVDSAYYGIDTFALCEVNPYVLITQQVYADIHPNLLTIPLASHYSMPYGLMYPNHPSEATMQFINAITE